MKLESPVAARGYVWLALCSAAFVTAFGERVESQEPEKAAAASPVLLAQREDPDAPPRLGARSVSSAPGIDKSEGVGPIEVVHPIIWHSETELDLGVAEPPPARSFAASVGTASLLAASTPLPLIGWRAQGDHPGTSFVSADTNIAAGKIYLVVTTRKAIGWYSKAGNQLGNLVAAENFFDLVGLGLRKDADVHNRMNDCRSLYDDNKNRFFVLCLYHHELHTPNGKLLVAVSKSTYPEAGWWQYVFDGANNASANPDDDTDYVSIGVDSQAFYTSGDVSGPGVPFKYHMVTLRSTDDLIHGLPAAQVRRFVFDNWLQPNNELVHGTVQPAVHHGTTSTAYLVARTDTSNQVAVFGVSNPFASPPTVRRVTVTLQPFRVPERADGSDLGLHQSPNSASTQLLWVDQLQTEPLKAEWRNNKLYFVNNDTIDCSDGPRPGLRFVRLNTTNFASGSVTTEKDRIFGCATTGDAANFDHGWPAVAVNQNGDAAIVFNRSNTTSFVQLRASAFLAADADISPSTLLVNSAATYRDIGPDGARVGWADCSGASVDPFDSTGIWLAGEYAVSPGSPPTTRNYAIWVAKLFGTNRADLSPFGLTTSSTTIPRGTSRSYTATYRNLGDASAASVAGKLYLSTNAEVGTSDTQIGTFTTSSAPSGTQRQTSFNATIPTTVAAGSYFLGFCLDTGLAIAEYNELNCHGQVGNIASIPVTVN